MCSIYIGIIDGVIVQCKTTDWKQKSMTSIFVEYFIIIIHHHTIFKKMKYRIQLQNYAALTKKKKNIYIKG